VDLLAPVSRRVTSDPTGVVPPPVDATFAALPPDVRLPDEATLLRTHRRECGRGPKPRCELHLDLDGDGADERVFLVRANGTGHVGVAVVWALGGVSVVGADVPMRQLRTDVYEDGVEVAWQDVEDDVEVLGWSVAQIQGDGFVVLGPKRRGAVVRSPPMRAPGRKGGGVLIRGSDSSTILYWDGAAWRRLVLF
jgi:hypothetical protein